MSEPQASGAVGSGVEPRASDRKPLARRKPNEGPRESSREQYDVCLEAGSLSFPTPLCGMVLNPH